MKWKTDIFTLTFIMMSCQGVAIAGPKTPATDDVNWLGRLAPWQDYIEEAAKRFDIPENWIRRVIIAESGGNSALNGRPIVSRAGAMGLMQLMPATYSDMQKLTGLGLDVQDPHDNIMAGSAYLKMLYEAYGYPGMFAAYNAGPGRYEASLRGVTLPLETRIYLQKVTRNLQVIAAPSCLFVRLSSGNAPAIPLKADGLFVSLTSSTQDEN